MLPVVRGMFNTTMRTPHKYYTCLLYTSTKGNPTRDEPTGETNTNKNREYGLPGDDVDDY